MSPTLPKDDRVGPDKRCPQCKGFIIGEPVVMKGGASGAREFCSSDCLLDAWESQEMRRRGAER